MFIYSIRASSLKLIGVIALTLALLVAVVGFGGGESVMAAGGGEISFGGVKTNDDRLAFIRQFGIEVEENPVEEADFNVPENLDRVIHGYNELQKKQNLDVTKYVGKRVTRYTYKVTNYNAEGEVYANLFIYRSKVIACDVCSASPDGFVVPMTLVEKNNLK